MGKAIIYDQEEQFKTELTFWIEELEDEYEIEIEVESDEKLEKYMTAYVLKDWEKLLGDEGYAERVRNVEFHGMTVSAKQEYGNVQYFLSRGQRAVISLNTDVLGDENADKVKQIENILKK